MFYGKPLLRRLVSNPGCSLETTHVIFNREGKSAVDDATVEMSAFGASTAIPGKPLKADHNIPPPPGCELISLLGSGGMGTVFLARQCHLNRLVAVKMLHKEFAANPVFINRLRSEAITLAAMNHPNVVGCHDIVTTTEGVYLIMEYIPGQLSVKSLLLRFGPLPEPLVVRILLDVVKGLAYVFEKGYTHFDLKPDNLLIYHDSAEPLREASELFLDKNTRVTICDFGISKQNGASQNPSASEPPPPGSVLGSPAYIAPEQVFFPEDVDFRADIYALAGTAFYMLTNSVPFTITERDLLLTHKLNHDIPDPSSMGAKISPEFAAILRRMGSADPGKRYGNYHDLLVELELLHDKYNQQLYTAWKAVRRLDFIKGGTAALLLLALLLGIFWGVKHVHAKYYQAVRVSLATSMGFWQGDGDWTAGKDPQEHTWTVTGKKARGWLNLIQTIHPGQNLQFKIRHPTPGSVICQIKYGIDQYGMFVWRRDADLKCSYSLYADRKVTAIGEMNDKKPIEWLECTFKLSLRKIILYVDGELAAVTHLDKPMAACHFAIRGINANMVQIKEVYISDLQSTAFNE